MFFFLGHGGPELDLEFLRGIPHGLDISGHPMLLELPQWWPTHKGKADSQHLTNGGHEELREMWIVHYDSD